MAVHGWAVVQIERGFPRICERGFSRIDSSLLASDFQLQTFFPELCALRFSRFHLPTSSFQPKKNEILLSPAQKFIIRSFSQT